MYTPDRCRVDGVHVAQEMERNQAAARHSWARQHTWLLLSFSPFPVRHTLHTLCITALNKISDPFLDGKVEALAKLGTTSDKGVLVAVQKHVVYFISVVE